MHMTWMPTFHYASSLASLDCWEWITHHTPAGEKSPIVAQKHRLQHKMVDINERTERTSETRCKPPFAKSCFRCSMGCHSMTHTLQTRSPAVAHPSLTERFMMVCCIRLPTSFSVYPSMPIWQEWSTSLSGLVAWIPAFHYAYMYVFVLGIINYLFSEFFLVFH